MVTFGINYDGTIISDDTTAQGMIDPIHYRKPSIAPSDMIFYRGNEFPAWNTHLLIGALNGVHLNKTMYQNNNLKDEQRLFPDAGRLRSFDVDKDGVIYLAFETPHRILKLSRLK